MRIFLALVIASLAFIPVVEASSRDYAFRDTTNAAPAGTLTLTQDEATTGTVPIPAFTNVTWADPVALVAPAAIRNGVFSYDVWFSTSENTVTITYGAIRGSSFVVLASATRVVENADTQVVPGTEIPATDTRADTGRMQGQLTIPSADLEAGDFLALRFRSNQATDLYTGPTFLGATSPSAATVPLPELPGLILTALGLMLVAGVVLVRRQRAA